MISSMAPNLPPVTLTDDAMKLCATILAVAADPKGTKGRLDELSKATTALRDAIAQHQTAKKQADDAAAALADVEQRAHNLASREDDLIASQTRLNVSAGAIADRDEAVKLKEQASDRRAGEIDARARALEDKLAAYRAALSA
jgi:chromosome segregation ATPase